jgi:hypothetical protein
MSQNFGNMWTRFKKAFNAWWEKHICSKVDEDWEGF